MQVAQDIRSLGVNPDFASKCCVSKALPSLDLRLPSAQERGSEAPLNVLDIQGLGDQEA